MNSPTADFGLASGARSGLAEAFLSGESDIATAVPSAPTIGNLSTELDRRRLKVSAGRGGINAGDRRSDGNEGFVRVSDQNQTD